MIKNISIAVIAFAALIVGVAFAYTLVSSNITEKQRVEAEEQAKKECSKKILPRARGDLVYGEYNKCMASKGFDEFK